MKQSVLIAGNGPSLQDISCNLLPDEYDVYRCNQFYFEDAYYTGKTVTKAFMNPSVSFEQYYTYWLLQERKEYTIHDVVLSCFHNPNVGDGNIPNIRHTFPSIHDGYDRYISKLEEIDTFLRLQEVYGNRRITSGVYMCLVAVAEGYTHIYVSGIDLYDINMGSMYAFSHIQPGIVESLPEFAQADSVYEKHDSSFDVHVLQMIQSLYGVTITCVSKSSPLFSLFPPSAIVDKQTRNIERKPEGYIHDIQYSAELGVIKTRDMRLQEEALQNKVLRFLVDLWKLPRAIRKYMKAKRVN